MNSADFGFHGASGDGFPGSPDGSLFSVLHGQLTFDAEGTETPGRWFSRSAKVPPGLSSGVTIGRGYDLGRRTPDTVIRDLLRAGVPEEDAAALARGAGLRGDRARAFLQVNGSRLPSISPEVQKTLFEQITYPAYVTDVRRIIAKPDVVSRYGATDWDSLDPRLQSVLVDLRYRGDYTPETRRFIQPYVVRNDLPGFTAVLRYEELWRGQLGVPRDRFLRRIQELEERSPISAAGTGR